MSESERRARGEACQCAQKSSGSRIAFALTWLVSSPDTTATSKNRRSKLTRLLMETEKWREQTAWIFHVSALSNIYHLSKLYEWVRTGSGDTVSPSKQQQQIRDKWKIAEIRRMSDAWQSKAVSRQVVVVHNAERTTSLARKAQDEQEIMLQNSH